MLTPLQRLATAGQNLAGSCQEGSCRQLLGLQDLSVAAGLRAELPCALQLRRDTYNRLTPVQRLAVARRQRSQPFWTWLYYPCCSCLTEPVHCSCGETRTTGSRQCSGLPSQGTPTGRLSWTWRSTSQTSSWSSMATGRGLTTQQSCAGWPAWRGAPSCSSATRKGATPRCATECRHHALRHRPCVGLAIMARSTLTFTGHQEVSSTKACLCSIWS